MPGTIVPNCAKVPGTAFQLDPVYEAFHFGTMIRWLDFNDTGWLRDEISLTGALQLTIDYMDPKKPSIYNGLTIELNDRRVLEEVFIEIPIGHKRGAMKNFRN